VASIVAIAATEALIVESLPRIIRTSVRRRIVQQVRTGYETQIKSMSDEMLEQAGAWAAERISKITAAELQLHGAHAVFHALTRRNDCPFCIGSAPSRRPLKGRAGGSDNEGGAVI
jgi:hypothetical protein